MIYLDNAATTRVFECAVSAAETAMRELYFNPNTTYKSGVEAKRAVENARREIAARLGAADSEIFFTSCASESNNWVFERGVKNPKGNVVISGGEHSSVYEPAMSLKNIGYDVRIAPLDRSGCVNAEALSSLIDERTSLVSVIHVSNETGVVNPIKDISKMVRAAAPRALIHSDGVQAVLKVSEPIHGLGVDLYSASAHKTGAPKGMGLLYIRKGVNLAPLIRGGGQERGLRSGTQNTPYILATAAAFAEYSEKANRRRMIELRNKTADFFVGHGCKIIGEGENSGYILCVCIPGVKAEIVQNAVHERGVVIGKGAACSGSKRGNRILSAMGLMQSEIESCIRISFSCDTSEQEVAEAAQIIIETANTLRRKNVR